MPVQVNEIVIRAVVEGNEPQRRDQETPQQQRQDIISECVEQVLEILKDHRER